MTAELAICLPAVVVVLTLVLALGAASVTQLRVTDAARAGARAAALGSTEAEIRRIVTHRAGPQAAVDVRLGSDQAQVRVTRALVTTGWGSWDVSSEFTAVVEPSGPGP